MSDTKYELVLSVQMAKQGLQGTELFWEDLAVWYDLKPETFDDALEEARFAKLTYKSVKLVKRITRRLVEEVEVPIDE